MNCPVCERSLAPTLSICPACGTMMHDSVREELQTKITPVVLPRIVSREQPKPVREPIPQRPLMVAMPIAKRTETADLAVSKTSPTLVEFQNKNASLPDWRLQLQNAVQQRKGGQSVISAQNDDRTYPTNGGAALKAEIVMPPAPEVAQNISDPRVANAMRRIDQSRQTFSEPQVAPKKPVMARPAPARSFPFDVVAPSSRTATAAAPARTPVTSEAMPRPKLVVPVAEKRDTNKLPPIERVIKIEDLVEEKVTSGALASEFAGIGRIQIKAEHHEIDEADVEIFDDEIEDLAPFSMRFGAGLFDLIISGFASMVILAPFAFTVSSWSTASGVLIFAATCAIVSFAYMTTCLGFFGKTMGMRLFSLELVDAVENEYPTLQQAAINSSIFLVSLPVCGAGFAAAYFNEERRALHDLVSGTIIVREF